jgi:hypothetical protein
MSYEFEMPDGTSVKCDTLAELIEAHKEIGRRAQAVANSPFGPVRAGIVKPRLEHYQDPRIAQVTDDGVRYDEINDDDQEPCVVVPIESAGKRQ